MMLNLGLLLIIRMCYTLNDINELVKENYCRERGLFTIYNKNTFKFVENEVGTNIALECRYCDDENDKEIKLWLQQFHRPNETLHEVELGMKSPLTKNRVFMTPDHTLFIQNIIQGDAGIYVCQGYETKNTDFQYIIDVIKKKVPVIHGNVSKWEEYNNKTVDVINTKLTPQIANLTESMGIKMKVVSEWESWSPCDGCQSIRQRTAKCRVKLRFNENLDKKATTAENTNTTKKQLLLNAYEMSCHSLDLAEWLPYVSAITSNVSNYAEVQDCMGPCKNKLSGPKKPIYANVYELKEGSYLTLICPESTMKSTVKWKKDGNKLKKDTSGADRKYQGHIYIDNFNVLHLSRFTKDQEGAYKCYVDDVFMQQIDVRINIETIFDTKGLKENSIYIISVFLFPFMVYFAGVVVICSRRREYYKIKFSNYA